MSTILDKPKPENKSKYSIEMLEKLAPEQILGLLQAEQNRADIAEAKNRNLNLELDFMTTLKNEFQHKFKLTEKELNRAKELLKLANSRSFGASSEKVMGFMENVINEVEFYDPEQAQNPNSSQKNGVNSCPGTDNSNEQQEVIPVNTDKMKAAQRKREKDSGKMNSENASADNTSSSKHKKGKGKTKGAKDTHPRKPGDDFGVHKHKNEVDPDLLASLNPNNLFKLSPLKQGYLVYVPGHWEYWDVETERFTYYPMGEECSLGPVREDGSVLITAESEIKGLFPRAAATASAVAYLAFQKYGMGVPVTRQARYFSENGFQISSQKISNWVIRAGEVLLYPLVKVLKSHLQQQSIVHMDETYITELSIKHETGRDKCFLVQACSGESMPEKIVLYEYFQSRSKDFVEAMLGDLSEREVAIHCDGYQVYHGFPDNVKIIGCHDHARREIFNAVKIMEGYTKYKKLIQSGDIEKIHEANNLCHNDPVMYMGLTLLEEYWKLYSIEREAKGKPYDEIQKIRQLESLPILENIYEIIEKALEDDKLCSSQTMRDALNYHINQKKYLFAYVEDGRFNISNCLCEAGMRRVSSVRKNCLFVDSKRGGHITAIYLTLIQTCIANHINPELYLKYVLEKLPGCLDNEEALEKLLPTSPDLPDELRVK